MNENKEDLRREIDEKIEALRREIGGNTETLRRDIDVVRTDVKETNRRLDNFYNRRFAGGVLEKEDEMAVADRE